MTALPFPSSINSSTSTSPSPSPPPFSSRSSQYQYNSTPHSNPNPNPNSGLSTPPPRPTSVSSSSWLNTITGNLTDGLTWIESQSGNVNLDSISGVGETIRGGLAGATTAVGRGKGGVVSRGLGLGEYGFGKLSGLVGGVAGVGGGTGGDGASNQPQQQQQYTTGRTNSFDNGAGFGSTQPTRPGSGGSLSAGGGGSALSTSPHTEMTGTIPNPNTNRPRPNSFLGFSRSNNNSRDQIVSASGYLGSSPGNQSLNNTYSSSAPHSPTKPTLPSSVSSPPGSSLSTDTLKRPPAPANMSRLTSQSQSQAGAGNASRPHPTTASARLNAHRPSLSTPNAPGVSASSGGSGSSSTSTNSIPQIPRSSSVGPNGGTNGSSSSLAIHVHDRSSSPSSSSTINQTQTLAPRSSSFGPFSIGNTLARSSSQRSHLSTHSETPSSSSQAHTNNNNNGHISHPSSSTPAAIFARQQSKIQTPYKPGFQPQGVRSSRMEEFERGRKEQGLERGKEEGRLGRRWAKLIDLHFNPNSTALSAPSTPETAPSLPRSPSFASSIADKRRSLLPNRDAIASRFDNIKAMDVWRGIRSVSGVGADGVEDEKKREVERGIVKWEDDSDVKRCRVCQSIFSISNRKHHCRICGRIVCSLPPTADSLLALAAQSASLPNDEASLSSGFNSSTGLPMGVRREKCSFLVVADWRTGKGEIVEEGFIGWMKADTGVDSLAGKKKGRRRKEEEGPDESDPDGPAKRQGKPKMADEIQVKGVRACRECWAIVTRKQKIGDMSRVSGFSRLYDVLKEVEREIQDVLPDFQDAMLAMNPEASDSPIIISPDTVAMHKQLVTLFTQYDTLTKRIRAQPCDQGSNQERLQNAIARSSSAFVAKEAGILQALPRLQKQRHKRAKSSLAASVISADSTPQASDAGSLMAPAFAASKLSLEEETATKLQPLLEQEAQIEEYIREANAQRKFDDAQTLNVSLSEIRAEISRLSSV